MNMSPSSNLISEFAFVSRVNFCNSFTMAIFISVIANLSPRKTNHKFHHDDHQDGKFTYTLPGTRSKWKPGKRSDVVSIFFEESLWFEGFRLRPELGVVVNHVIRKFDVGAFLDLKSSEFPRRVDPILDT